MDKMVITIERGEKGVSITTENTEWKDLMCAAVLLIHTVYKRNFSKYKPLKAFLNDFQQAAIATYDDFLKEKSISEE